MKTFIIYRHTSLFLSTVAQPNDKAAVDLHSSRTGLLGGERVTRAADIMLNNGALIPVGTITCARTDLMQLTSYIDDSTPWFDNPEVALLPDAERNTLFSTSVGDVFGMIDDENETRMMMTSIGQIFMAEIPHENRTAAELSQLFSLLDSIPTDRLTADNKDTLEVLREMLDDRGRSLP